MSLSSVNMINLFALSNLTAVGRAQEQLGSSIEKLSTGLALNHAKDNASALSISEKMRSYINGLKKAALNAQDGTSYLQTAEGATEEVVSMLQRMRELAVQGANGTYTANDRMEIQKEMDQLKDEIDRIAQHSEFNTKKLLNGESSGFWNSSTEKIGAVITGPVEEGNYDISVEVEPGKNQIQQSHIFSLKEGSLGAEITSSGGSNITEVRNPNQVTPSLDTDYSVTVAGSMTAGDTANVISTYFQDDSMFVAGNIDNVESNASGYMVVEFTENSDSAGAVGTAFRAKFISAETGAEGGWVNYTTGVDGSLSAVYTSAGFNVSFEMAIDSGVDSVVKNGDRLLIAVSDDKGFGQADDLLASGGGTLTLNMNGKTGPTVTYAAIGSLTSADNRDGIVDVNEVSLYCVELNEETGNLTQGSITMGFKETAANNAGHGVTKSGVMTFEVRGGGEAATLTTKLSDIANFVDSDGNDILQNTQEIRIYGNASFATVLIEGGDTVEDLRDKLTKAIVDDLNMGSSDAFINKRLVEYIPSEGGSGLKAVRGTMLIQSALTGDDSNLSFIGDQRVLDAFGLAEVQSAENNISTVTVSDHHTGVLIGSVVTDEKKAKDLIKGADITIDTRTGAEAVWNPATEAIEFKERLSVENYSMNLHIVESGTEIQIGTSEGESVDVSVPQLDTVALGIDNTVITSQGEAQKAINDLDKAIAMVNNVRATIGAKINRLDSAYATLQAAKENISATESRIRDTDMAEESAALATAQVMSQASLSMLAQANQLPSQALMLLQA